ncbi:Testicular acid phosphatase-like protein [Harpegnathos saltator]|uniref:acid phosphatase n=1 Tax=Harpegnathos saltator TaxID=610380 RepID=E2BDF5_HARSA|nr:Testicular acid phosphatase-like protein [Harpegnathos saltator]
MAKLYRYLSVVLLSCSAMSSELAAHYSKQHGRDTTKLRFISMLFRHGDRTLDLVHGETYPNDPYKDLENYPTGDGQLTNAGKKRSYELGKILRRRYNDFLGDYYYQPNIYARSTGFARAKMTLQLIMAGLYPPKLVQRWMPNLSWQPVDFEFLPANGDGLLGSLVCPTYQEKLTEIRKTPEVIEQAAQFDDVKERLIKYTGFNITNVLHFFTIYHTLYTQHYLNLSLPEWTQNFFPNGSLLDATIFVYNLLSYNEELTKLNGGKFRNQQHTNFTKLYLFCLIASISVLLYKIIQDMNGVINGTLAERKLDLFAAHDINVIALLQALGIYDNTFPHFSSGIIIELHEKNKKYFVRVLHHLGIPAEMKEVKIPGCDVLCPYEQFVKLRSSVTAEGQIDKLCPLESNNNIILDVNYLL